MGLAGYGNVRGQDPVSDHDQPRRVEAVQSQTEPNLIMPARACLHRGTGSSEVDQHREQLLWCAMQHGNELNRDEACRLVEL